MRISLDQIRVDYPSAAAVVRSVCVLQLETYRSASLSGSDGSEEILVGRGHALPCCHHAADNKSRIKYYIRYLTS